MDLTYDNSIERKGGTFRIALGGPLAKVMGMKSTQKDRTPLQDKVFSMQKNLEIMDFDSAIRDIWVEKLIEYPNILVMNSALLAVAVKTFIQYNNGEEFDDIGFTKFLRDDKLFMNVMKPLFPKLTDPESIHYHKYDLIRYVFYIHEREGQ
ncbi:MAG: hypothetical protein AAB966_01545 [Patescibacteria group bacterium]